MKKSRPEVVRVTTYDEWMALLRSGVKQCNLKIDATPIRDSCSLKGSVSDVWTALYRSSKTGCYHIQWGQRGDPKISFETAEALAFKALVDIDHLWQIDFVKPHTALGLQL